jgi:hypothetical protein
LPTLEQQEISVLKGRVSRLEARLEFLYRNLGVTFIEDTRPTDDPRIIEALKANNLLEAIKLYRMATNASLEAARAGVEEMRGGWGFDLDLNFTCDLFSSPGRLEAVSKRNPPSANGAKWNSLGQRPR